jgi:hypothetical protein
VSVPNRTPPSSRVALVVRRITVLVTAGAVGIAVGSILPLPGRTNVAAPLGNGARVTAAVAPAAIGCTSVAKSSYIGLGKSTPLSMLLTTRTPAQCDGMRRMPPASGPMARFLATPNR